MRSNRDTAFSVMGFASIVLCLGIMALLIGALLVSGFERFSVGFFFNFPSRMAEKAGILSAWVGSVCVIIITALFAVPTGIAAGVYLEEYEEKGFVRDLIEVCITNLAGVPSIVFGLMALGLFVYRLHLGQSLLTAGLTLALLVLPIVIVATREALRAIPQNLREAAFALGATQEQVILHHLLPSAASGILTGVILSISRALGETAPLITVGALTYVAFLPKSIMDPFTVLPIQVFNWVSRPQEAFHSNAAAASLMLMALTLGLTSFAIIFRNRVRKRSRGHS